MADDFDFWGTDYFDPPTPKAGPKAPAAPKPPKIVPDSNQLFTVQKNALTTLNALKDLELAMRPKRKPGEKGGPSAGERELRAALRAAENTYRVIRTYLKENIHV